MLSRRLSVRPTSALHAAKQQDACSRAALRAERGLGRLLARLDDDREEVRNDVLVLLGRTTAGSLDRRQSRMALKARARRRGLRGPGLAKPLRAVAE